MTAGKFRGRRIETGEELAAILELDPPIELFWRYRVVDASFFLSWPLDVLLRCLTAPETYGGLYHLTETEAEK